MRPPIQYFGAKGELAPAIVALFPPHRGYVEPFGGSLAVLLAKEPSKIEVANDLDGRLMTFWRVLRERPEELLRVTSLTPHARDEVVRAAALDGENDLELARQVFVMLTQGRSRTLRRTGWRFFTDPAGSSAGFAQYLEAYLGRIAPAAERLINVSLECRPALDVIAQYGAFEDNLLYVDPPYVTSTLASAHGSRYTHGLNDDGHAELAQVLSECKANVVVSGYASDLYDDAFEGWHVETLKAHSGNALEPAREEVVWCNFPVRSRLFA